MLAKHFKKRGERKQLSALCASAHTRSPGYLWRKAFIPLGVFLLAGCGTTVPSSKLPVADPDGHIMRQVMARQDRIIHISTTMPGKFPALILLHGATEDPTEMMDIARDCQSRYDVFLYSYNFHERISKIGAHLAQEVEWLKGQGTLGEDVTFVVYSYSAIPFRQAVIMSDPKIFADACLVQLVPTAGGSRWGVSMRFPPWLPKVVSLASKPSVAEAPFGSLAEQLWDGPGNQKFYQVIKSNRVQTVRLEGDPHSLEQMKNRSVQRRYHNGLGPNVMVIPKTEGLSHDYFTTNAICMSYLNLALDQLRKDSLRQQQAGSESSPHRLATKTGPASSDEKR